MGHTSSKNLKIAIVEDDLAMLSMISDFLTLQGHKILEFTHSEQLLSQWIEDLDLIISDFHMPGLSGLELIKKVKQIAPHLPIIVSTAFANENLEAAAVAAGAKLVLKKPFKLSELVKAIHY